MNNPMTYGTPYPKGNPMARGISNSFCEEAKDLFSRLSLLGTPASDSRKVLYNNLILRLKREKGLDNSTSQWDSTDVINLIAQLKNFTQTEAAIFLRRYYDIKIPKNIYDEFNRYVNISIVNSILA